MIDPLTTSLITTVMGLVPGVAKDRERIKAFRENVRAEIDLNLKLLEDFLKASGVVRADASDSSKLSLLFEKLSVERFAKLCDSEISVGRVFSQKLSRPELPTESDGKGTIQYLDWIKKDVTLADLLRRFYGRVEFLRRRHSTARVDVRYLAFLLRVARSSVGK